MTAIQRHQNEYENGKGYLKHDDATPFSFPLVLVVTHLIILSPCHP
jgi:hypothetical protein